MNNKIKLTLASTALALGGVVYLATAQENSDNPISPGGQHGNRMNRRPPVPLIVRALDVNKDGVIDADEIANASAALKMLDKNGDGKLTMDEIMGPRPQRRGAAGGPPALGDGGNPPPDDNNLPPGPPPDEN